MKNNLEVLNLKLPDIKRSNRSTKSVKENNKSMMQKIKEKNVIRFKRNFEIINHIKNNSRNKNQINLAMNNNNNDITNQSKERLYNFNNTPNKDLHSLNNNFIYSSVDDISCLNKDNKNNSLTKLNSEFKALELKTPNTINSTKNSYYLNLYSKNGFINNSNFSFYKNRNNRNNSISSTMINNKKYISINEGILKKNNFTQNNIKVFLAKGNNKNASIKNFESQLGKSFVKNKQNMNNLKFQLIMPKIMHSSKETKQYQIFEDNKFFKNITNNDKYFVSQTSMLKELRNIENLNNINNFITILKQHILIEIEFNDFILSNNNINQFEHKMINKVKSLINLYNTFFNQLDYITFEMNIFINKDYNSLLQKMLKLLIYYHCFIFIFLILNDVQSVFIKIKANYINILKKISFCLYNVFTKYMYKELSSNKYKDLSFISSLNSLYNNSNNEYVIKSTLSNNGIYNLLLTNFNSCLDIFIKALNNEKGFLEEVSISLKHLLLNLNKKDLIHHIDICLNSFLYSALEKNIKKAKLNTEKNSSTKKNKSLNLVPYLPPLEKDNKFIGKYTYTIVLDIDETLGHFIHNEIKSKYFSNYGYIIEENNKLVLNNEKRKDKIRVGIFMVRPYAKYFLEKLNNLFFEIVIFSAGTKEYCDKVLDILDLNNNIIKYRLYRSHLSLRNINNDVKDLSLLGRDLSKVIMIDNFSENYKLQQDNGLPINSWTGDASDTSLRDLIPIMNYIVENNVEDVRHIVKKIKSQLNNFSKNEFNYEKINLKF